jgi:hypothetical protein
VDSKALQLRLAGSDHALESIEVAGLGKFVRGETGRGVVHRQRRLRSSARTAQAEQFKWDTDFLIWHARPSRPTNPIEGHKVRVANF